MSAQNDERPEPASALRTLIEVNTDSFEGFKMASEVVGDPEFTAFFKSQAEMRSAHARELAAFVEPGGAADGSLTGSLHRWWIKIKGTVSGGALAPVLGSVVLGEDQIRSYYETLLPAVSGTEAEETVRRQHDEVKQRYEQIRSMLDDVESRS